ncbi:SNF2 helicase associated domain-containing protein [Niallia sp. 01092]|uniref:SNF2 helicase associated domain-containing protein n=1 Tax=unclassified Niallia TaxID=2837522 RepID=UPI003FD167FE
MASSLLRLNIKQMFSASNYQNGKRYFRQGKVQNLFCDESKGRWSATVSGSKRYQVVIQEVENKYKCSCNCPAFNNWYDEECKHIAAVLFEIQESGAMWQYEEPARKNRLEERQQMLERQQAELMRQQQVRQSAYVNQLTNQFIDKFSTYYQETIQQEKVVEKQPLMVEWICKMHNKKSITLEIKVGLKRPYVLKDIKKFLEAIKWKEQYPFTKNFTYDPTEYTFSEVDQEVINLLQEGLNFEKMYQNLQSPYYGSGLTNDVRAIVLSPMIADKVLQKLMQGNVQLYHNGQLYNQLQFQYDEHSFLFQLEKAEGQDYQLNVADLSKGSYFRFYGYFVKEDSIYKISEEQQPFLEELITLVERTKSPILPISKEQVEPLLSYVVPIMDEVGKVQVADNISNKIIKIPLQSHLYVDMKDQLLRVDLEFRYGEHKMNPFQYIPPKETILIRDTEKEQLIMSVLESSSLKSNGEFLYTKEEEGIFEFVYKILPQLEEKAAVYLTSAVKNLILSESHVPVTNIDVDASGNWLEVNFSMEGIDQKTIQKIMKSAVEKKKYYRLPCGTFVSLESEQFHTIRHLFVEMNLPVAQLEKEAIKLPLYRGVQLEELVSGENTKSGEQYLQLLTRLKNPEELNFGVTSSLQAELRDYQHYGFQWLSTLKYYGFGGVLADDMGLGKTLQSIALLLSDKEKQKEKKPALIVAPASLVYNWKNELKKFAPSLKTEIMIGSPTERKELFRRSAVADVWITSYPTLRQDMEEYVDRDFHTLILDEAQVVKNYATKTAKAVSSIQAETRFALSGTPIENSLDELWSIFQIVMPDFFPNQKKFRELSPEKVASMIKPFLLRRMKKDVLKELPDKIETLHVSELTKHQKEHYLAYLEKMKEETEESLKGEGFQKSRMKILAGLTRLRQLCCHPSLFLETYNGDSGKLKQLVEIVVNAVENGRRLLIFSQFTSMLDIISRSLEKEGLSFFRLDGQTSSKERIELVERYNKKETAIFLISLKAGNTGLNLTEADTVILYDLWWNPAVEEQAIGRAHRMGQKNVVQVIRLITKGTIEEKMHELQQTKKELIETIMEQGDQDKALSRMTEKDIREILNI